MIATLTIIAIAFTWLAYETDWFTVRLETTEYQIQQNKIKAIIPEPILALPAGDPMRYMMTLATDIKTLRAMVDELSKTELELTEEVHGYDYSDQT